MHKLFQLVLLALLFICNASVADVIVRMEIQQGAAIDNVDFRLYDGEAPVTVTNFLNYVNDGDYDQSFVHRSVPGFVVQGGGFIYYPTLNDFPDGLQRVPADAPIVNEFGRSNLRGTVAMAKLAGDPDSATSQWFINLEDNSASLDIDNGGYTVFGDVLNNGMAVVDSIASQPIYDGTDIYSAFGDLPLVDFVPTNPIENNNLVKFNSVNELFWITPDIDYGTVTTGSSVQPEITIKNTGSEALQIGAIGDTNPVDDPFRIIDARCANSIIRSGDQCSFMVLFSPDAEDSYIDSFNIEIVSHKISYEVSLSGIGETAEVEPDITVATTSVDFGTVDILDGTSALPYEFPQIVQNSGSLELALFSIDITGQDAGDIDVSGNCIGLVALPPGGFCSLTIEFKPLLPGDKIADIVINTDDPDENPFIMPIRGAVLAEDDGVPAFIEDAGPNNGDGNNDDTLDSKQSNVATLVDSYGHYVTYLMQDGFRFSGMTALQESDVAAMPEDVVIGSGIFHFNVLNVVPGQFLEVGIILPPEVVPSAYYIYGPTADNPVPHWYKFDFDGETGAIIINGITFTTSDGRVFSRNLLKVIHKDGARGDSDMTENGVVAVTGGMPTTFASDEGSGSISYILFLSIAALLLLTRNISHTRNIGDKFH